MWKKYILSEHDWTVGFKINETTGKVVLGGLLRLNERIEIIKADYFRKKGGKLSYPMHNKITYSWRMSVDDFKKAVKRMEKDGFIIQQVQSHGRLMR